MIKKTIKILTLTLCVFNFMFFGYNCKTPYVVEQDFLSLSFTNSDATTTSDGYIYYLSFVINELGESGVTIDSVSISINKDSVAIAQYDYIST